MKDIPVFSCEYGTAGLVLREIPYRQEAYIRIHGALDTELLIRECIDFCSAVGAQHIYVAGDVTLEKYPLHTEIWNMEHFRIHLGNTDAVCLPADMDTVDVWRKMYNSKAARIPNAAWMTEADAAQMCENRQGYYVMRGETLLGIGRVDASKILWVSASVPGAGADVVRALAGVAAGDTVSLEVASANEKAVSFYVRLGFVKTAVLSRWHKVL